MVNVMITVSQIQARLIEAIKQSGLSQTEIARKIVVSQSCIAHYLKGDIIPSIDTFANLCKALDLDPAYILCLQD